MQTIPVNSKLSMKTVHPVPANRIVPMPPSLVGPLPGIQPSEQAPAALSLREHAQVNPFSELDQMLLEDPNVGAVNGLRFALLFNAGLAVSGLVIWELWSMIAF